MPLSFLTLGPTVEVETHTVQARTSLLFAVLTLGAWRDAVTVDLRKRTVGIRRTKFWAFVSDRTIPFRSISEIAYSMIDQSAGSFLKVERDGLETFDVALPLYRGEEVPLLRFSGDGEYTAEVSLAHEWLHDRWIEATDIRGDQQERSLGVVELLSARIGVPLGSSRYF